MPFRVRGKIRNEKVAPAIDTEVDFLHHGDGHGAWKALVEKACSLDGHIVWSRIISENAEDRGSLLSSTGEVRIPDSAKKDRPLTVVHDTRPKHTSWPGAAKDAFWAVRCELLPVEEMKANASFT